MKNTYYEQSENYKRIEQVIEYLSRNFKEQPSLDEIAASVHLSKYHFQRVFKRWAGVTPSQFLQFLTIEYAKEQLSQAQSILDTTLDSGLSSTSRLHDLFVTFEAMTPGEYKRQAAGLEIYYGCHATPFGNCLVAATDRGICALRFTSDVPQESILVQMRTDWPNAQLIEKPERTQPIIDRLFNPIQEDETTAFHLLLKGTNFQVQVWKALLAIPAGTMVSYEDIAGYMAKPKAVRAVANAVAVNPIGYIIPCHRVISKTGKIYRYRWGESRKKAILGWEASHVQIQAA